MKRIVLNGFLSKNNTNENIVFKEQFIQTNRPLPPDPLDEVVDLGQVFREERNTIQCHRFLGNLNFVASNVLMNWDGPCSYQDIIAARDFDDDTQEYVFEQEEVLLEDDGWFYYLTGDSACNRKYLEPTQDRFGMYNFSGDTNWNLWMTYPASGNVETLIFNGVPITTGIALYSATTLQIDDRIMTAFICSINHGLTVDDEIFISGTTSTGYEGVYNVYELGFGDGTYQSNTFIVDINLGTPPSLSGTGLYAKRRVEGISSEYYGRWFRKFSLTSHVKVHDTAFATNIFNDQIYSYLFTEDYDLSTQTDYLGRPLTEVYLSVVKKQDYNTLNGSGFWTLVESGLKTMIFDSEYDINTINTVTSNDSIEDDVNNSNVLIFGDIVEYNPVSQLETVLEVAYHRFNSQNREDNNFLEGYYYKPHYKMQIRQFSDYINNAFSGDTEVVPYAEIFPDGRATWRDVLPNDFANGTTIPFLNGCHYVYLCANVLVQRQDPCGLYDLGNTNFVIGDCDVDEQFRESEIIDICE